MSTRKMRVGILGATGVVGQRFVELLRDHPWFEIAALAASDASVGKVYRDSCTWRMNGDWPAGAGDLMVQPCVPPLDCELVFSALPASVAGEVEESFAQAGYPVITNSRNHRMDPDVPVLVPEINADHVRILEAQRKRRGYSRGFIVTNPNCSATALVMALAPVHRSFGLRAVQVTTLQAISGAGYPGVPASDLVDNVIPYIAEEEEKIERETKKILGELVDGQFRPDDLALSAQCHRVNVRDGHLEAVSIGLKRPASPEEIRAAWESFSGPPQELRLPSAPARPIVVREEPDRPQPSRDRDAEHGMATVVGRLRPCPVLDYKFVLLGHNTVRGAAGGTILIAEYLRATGWI